ATDTAGNISDHAEITVIVDNGGADTTPPTASITSIADGATVSGRIEIWASANDDSAVTKVSFYVDGAYLNYDTTDPWGRALQTNSLTDGPHTLSVRATDTAGNISDHAEITVIVQN
ncbi:MAG: Ig-like domain-containing protein, partial [Dehalococcoidia bacterium]